MSAYRILLAAACVAFAVSIVAEEPGLKRGFDATKLYDFGTIDSVNTFNGNLTLRIPLGPAYSVRGGLSYALTLTYNSKVWDYEERTGVPRAIPSRHSNAGLGWTLTLGKMIAANDMANDVYGHWQYGAGDGGLHIANEALHPGATVTSGVHYTTDGSYLRVTSTSNLSGTSAVEAPDGTVHHFAADGNLSSINDRSGDSITVDYLTSMTGTPCPANDVWAWRIRDSENARTNWVCFQDNGYSESVYNDLSVERIVLAAPPASVGGAVRSASYQFTYSVPSIARGCHSQVQNDPTSLAIPTLSGLFLPDGSAYGFTYNTTGNAGCNQGTLASARLPTGALLTYEYAYFPLPTEQCARLRWNSNIVGVGSRTISGPRLPTATWTYTRSFTAPANMTVLCDTNTGVTAVAPPNEEMIVAVTDPQGDVTEHYYSVWPDVNTSNPDGFDAKEYGLPFSRRTASSSGYLSERLYSAAGYTASPRQSLRSVYVHYDIDAFTGCTPLAGGVCQDTNRRVTFERTVDHDDGGRVADTTYSDFDGLGHFRSVRRDGTFTSGNVTTVMAFNRIDPAVNPIADVPDAFDSGTYPASFNLPPLTHPWVLNTYPTTVTTEDDDGTFAKTFSCFDAATGVLRARRVGTGSSANDLLAVFTTNHGDVTQESYFGGDVAHDAQAASLCSVSITPPSQAEYTLTHTYTTGIRATSAYAGVTFKSLNLTIDSASGATMSSSDPSSFVTIYSYDTAFRLTRVTPPAGLAATTYSYASGAGFENGHFTPAALLQTALSGSSAGTTGNVGAEYQYDALGRMWREKQRLPDAGGSPVWNVRETLRSPAGYVTSISAPEQLIIPSATQSNPAPTEYDFTPGHQTSYAGYDPFGRPSSITAPDGHVTTLTYKGSRSSSRTVSVATGRSSAVNGEEPVASTELHDRQGRIEAVVEAQVQDVNGSGQVVTDYSTSTSYRYDAWGHLASVSMPSGLDTQLRLFSYDARGLLVSEQHPEIGHAGNGTILHSDYDSRGNAHRQVTGGTFETSLTFDSAERVTGVSSGATNLKTFVYDDQSGVYNSYCNDNPRCQNKIAAAARWNNLGDLGNVPVSEAFQYEGPGGLMTRRDIAAGSTMTFDGLNFAAAQTYNDLGQPYSLTYPFRKDAAGQPLAGERARTVQQAYANGFLSAVTEPGSTQWASSINYHSSGLLKTVAHGSGSNAATETWDAETTGIPRVARITATAANGSPAYDSGAYAYDGAGNIRTIGSTTLTYDFWGRLETSSDSPSTYTQHFYDRYGNRRGSHLFYRTPPCYTDGSGQHCLRDNVYLEPVDGTTNHYLASSYDDAGNVIADGNRSFAYDALDMMTAATVQGRQFRYLYTSDDERLAVVERVAQPDSSVRNRTSWTLRGLGPHLLTVWTDDSTSGSRAVTWKEDEIWRGESLLGSDVGSGPRSYTLDHLGSPRRLFSSSGLSIGSQDYSPFGTGGTSNGGSLQFTGQERDANLVTNGPTDLPDSFHARMYDAGRGRFLSVDPLLGDSRSPQTWNRYAYARNNPINHIDPTGMSDQRSGALRYDEEITVTAKNPSDQEHFLFLQHETKELDLPFMGDWFSAHLFPNELWGSFQTKQSEKLVGHPVTPGEGVLLMTMAIFGGPTGEEAGTGAGAADEVAQWWAPAAHEARMSRWMSEAEASAFMKSGNLQIGAGNRTFMARVGAPKAGNWGPVRMDFNVPTAALEPGGQEGWYFIGGWNRVPVTGIIRVP